MTSGLAPARRSCRPRSDFSVSDRDLTTSPNQRQRPQRGPPESRHPVMRKFEWNALRPHDKVLVHDGVGTDLALIPGVVTAVEVRKRRHTVGIRVTTGNGAQRVLWPSSLSVHHAL